ncbi:MAG: branched-chain amino acid aminotransferase [Bacteroidales bacterium]|nr:branched-chain amino acid aminotransferase [Bacteroidales bacterium]
MEALDWNTLGFKYRKTNTVLTSLYRNGEWGPVKSQTEDKLKLTVCSPSVHYGMSCFEGLKAFRGVDGKIRLFRPEENAVRMQSSASFLGIPAPDTDLFISMCIRAVEENLDYLPPFGYNASLYVRPVLVTTDPSVNLVPQDDGILFMVFTFPVGTYSGGTVLHPIKTAVARDFDRAAPFGSGRFKVCGNYAGAMFAESVAVKLGYGDVLFLDPATRTYVDEFSSANFFGIVGNTYMTPLSDSVLPSITNKSLFQIADDMGMNAVRTKIKLEEVEQFEEVGECGTAAVITPVCQLDDCTSIRNGDITRSWMFGHEHECGPVCRKLYEHLTGIQFGTVEDEHDWCTII